VIQTPNYLALGARAGRAIAATSADTSSPGGRFWWAGVGGHLRRNGRCGFDSRRRPRPCTAMPTALRYRVELSPDSIETPGMIRRDLRRL